MKHYIRISTTLCCLLALAACGPDRAAADKRLSEACLVALKTMYDPNDSIDIKSTAFVSEDSPEGTNLRTVKFHAYYVHNHGIIQEKDYACSFEETLPIPRYQAKFYRLDRGDLKLGSYDGIIHGDLNDMLKINTAVAPILN